MDSQDYIEAVASHAMATGFFGTVEQAEPKSAPQDEMSLAVWVQSLRPHAASSGLASTSARMALSVRLYQKLAWEPRDLIDPRMMEAVDALITAYSDDFTLDGMEEVMAVDLLGIGGEGLGGDAGYVEIDKTWFRVFTINLPILISNAWRQRP